MIIVKAKISYEGKIVNRIPDMKVGDYGRVLTFFIENENSSAKDITNMTIKFVAKELVTEKCFVDSICTIQTASSGICFYTFKNNDLCKEGSFDCYLLLRTTGFEERISLGYLNIF